MFLFLGLFINLNDLNYSPKKIGYKKLIVSYCFFMNIDNHKNTYERTQILVFRMVRIN